MRPARWARWTLYAWGIWIASPVHCSAAPPVVDEVRRLPFVREVQRPAAIPAADSLWAEAWEDTALALACAKDFADLHLVDSLGVVHPFLLRPPMLAEPDDGALAASRRTPRVRRAFYVPRARFQDGQWSAEIELRGPAVALCRLVLTLPAEPVPREVVVAGRAPDGSWPELHRSRLAPPVTRPGDAAAVPVEFGPFRTGALRLQVTAASASGAPVLVDSVQSTPVRFLFPYSGARRWFAYGDPRSLPAGPQAGPAPPAGATFVHVELGKPHANPHYGAGESAWGAAWRTWGGVVAGVVALAHGVGLVKRRRAR